MSVNVNYTKQTHIISDISFRLNLHSIITDGRCCSI